MSARQPFFPRPESRATFSPDQGNPLHQKSAANNTAVHDLKQQNGAHKPADTQTNIDGANSYRTAKTSGLGGLKKKIQAAGAGGSVGGNARTAVTNMIRPGTADPHSLMHRALEPSSQTPVIAPTPQKPNSLVSSALLSRSRSSAGYVSFPASSDAFKVPSLDFSNKSVDFPSKILHTSTLEGLSGLRKDSHQREGGFSGTRSDEHHQSGTYENGTSSDFILDQGNGHGPRRVMIQPDTHHYSVGMEEHSSGFRGVQGHELTQDGRLKQTNSRKRAREEYEQDDHSFEFENPAKRYRGQPNDMDNSLPDPKFSPNVERPSSGFSLSMNRHQSQSVHGSPFIERSPQILEDRKSRSPTKLQTYEGHDMQQSQQSQQSQGESNALEKLLGQDPNVYVRDHMDVYENLVNKWRGCTMDEWAAGADEITSRYHEMLDYVKDFVSVKLKLYGTLHKSIDDHNSVLRQRNDVLNVVKKKLVQESGSVLGN